MYITEISICTLKNAAAYFDCIYEPQSIYRLWNLKLMTTETVISIWGLILLLKTRPHILSKNCEKCGNVWYCLATFFHLRTDRLLKKWDRIIKCGRTIQHTTALFAIFVIKILWIAKSAVIPRKKLFKSKYIYFYFLNGGENF